MPTAPPPDALATTFLPCTYDEDAVEGHEREHVEEGSACTHDEGNDGRPDEDEARPTRTVKVEGTDERRRGQRSHLRTDDYHDEEDDLWCRRCSLDSSTKAQQTERLASQLRSFEAFRRRGLALSIVTMHGLVPLPAAALAAANLPAGTAASQQYDASANAASSPSAPANGSTNNAFNAYRRRR